MTGDSIRIQLGVDTIQYLADTTEENLLQKINAHPSFDKSILVIGHSNTLPMIIKKLGVKPQLIPEISDTEFDNLFIIKITKKK